MGQCSQVTASCVNTVMNILVPHKTGISQLANSNGLSTRALLNGISFELK